MLLFWLFFKLHLLHYKHQEQCQTSLAERCPQLSPMYSLLSSYEVPTNNWGRAATLEVALKFPHASGKESFQILLLLFLFFHCILFTKSQEAQKSLSEIKSKNLGDIDSLDKQVVSSWLWKTSKCISETPTKCTKTTNPYWLPIYRT